MKASKTFLPKVDQIERKFYLIDASDKILGRIAAKAATLLRGKHKPTFSPHLDMGDTVIIINAEKIRVTGKKMTDKVYLRYSGYPSGQRGLSLKEMLEKSPTKVLRLAINRMIPKGRLGNTARSRLRIYAGDKHPHVTPTPIPLEL